MDLAELDAIEQRARYCAKLNPDYGYATTVRQAEDTLAVVAEIRRIYKLLEPLHGKTFHYVPALHFLNTVTDIPQEPVVSDQPAPSKPLAFIHIARELNNMVQVAQKNGNWADAFDLAFNHFLPRLTATRIVFTYPNCDDGYENETLDLNNAVFVRADALRKLLGVS